MSIAPIQHINTILIKIKETVEKENGKNFIFKHRDKNKDTLTKLQWLPSHVKEEILTLTYRNYSRGPERNESSSGNSKGAMWIFGKHIKNIDVYIKIHVIPFKETQCVCVSFHEEEPDKEKLTFPYAT